MSAVSSGDDIKTLTVPLDSALWQRAYADSERLWDFRPLAFYSLTGKLAKMVS